MHNIFIRTFKAGCTKRIVIVEQVSIEHRVVFFSLNGNGFNGIVPSEFLIAKLESLYLPFMPLFHKLHIRLIDFRRRDAVADDVDEEKFLRPRMSHFCEASQAGALAVGTGEEDGTAPFERSSRTRRKVSRISLWTYLILRISSLASFVSARLFMTFHPSS